MSEIPVQLGATAEVGGDGSGEALLPIAFEARAREIAREEIASLAGLVLRRTQEVVEDTGDVTEVSSALQAIFGEVLRDFGSTVSEPGES